MKSLILVVALLLPVVVQAGACRPIEYAQVKDMTTEELVAKYCQYVAARNDYVVKIDELTQKRGDLNFAWIGGANECKREQEKIATVLKARAVLIPGCQQ